MLRLDIPTQAFWVDCPHGVRLLCRPLTTAMNHAAVTRAGRRLREAEEAAPGDAMLADPDVRAGMVAAEVVAALGEVLVEAWEGVGAAEGDAPAPLTRDGIRAVLSVPEIAMAFNAGISAPITRLAAEGNA